MEEEADQTTVQSHEAYLDSFGWHHTLTLLINVNVQKVNNAARKERGTGVLWFTAAETVLFVASAEHPVWPANALPAFLFVFAYTWAQGVVPQSHLPGERTHTHTPPHKNTPQQTRSVPVPLALVTAMYVEHWSAAASCLVCLTCGDWFCIM
jgi:hypothetical protein